MPWVKTRTAWCAGATVLRRRLVSDPPIVGLTAPRWRLLGRSPWGACPPGRRRRRPPHRRGIEPSKSSRPVGKPRSPVGRQARTIVRPVPAFWIDEAGHRIDRHGPGGSPQGAGRRQEAHCRQRSRQPDRPRNCDTVGEAGTTNRRSARPATNLPGSRRRRMPFGTARGRGSVDPSAPTPSANRRGRFSAPGEGSAGPIFSPNRTRPGYRSALLSDSQFSDFTLEIRRTKIP
jgi:hypothetical protein